LNKTKL